MSQSMRESALEGLITQLRVQFATMQQLHLTTLATIVHYVGGELRLSQEDYMAAKGVLLTEQLDEAAQCRIFRTRRVGQDGGDELARGGLLPPDAGRGVTTGYAKLSPEEEAAWKAQTIDGYDAGHGKNQVNGQPPLPFSDD